MQTDHCRSSVWFFFSTKIQEKNPVSRVQDENVVDFTPTFGLQEKTTWFMSDFTFFRNVS